MKKVILRDCRGRERGDYPIVICIKNINTVTIGRRSIINNKWGTINININPIEFVTGLLKHQQGEFIQDVFPQLTSDEREFIISGIDSEEWDTIMEDNELSEDPELT